MIRILADRSKDSSGAAQFANLLPYFEFESTDNRLGLKRRLLNEYDVLAICGQSVKKYTRAQLTMIREFVEAGGGLVLAASAPAFELDADRPVAKMAQNSVAALFGAAFLPSDCAGARVDASLQVGFRQEDIIVRKRPALGDAGPGLVLGCCGPISPPEGAETLASHRATRQPVAAAFEFGEGRVVMVGASHFANEREFTCGALARWLASGRKGRCEGDARIPECIGLPGDINRGDYFHVTCDHGSVERLDEAVALLGRVDSACRARFGNAWEPYSHIGLDDALCPRHPFFSHPRIGSQAPDGSLARQMLAALFSKGIRGWIIYECLAAVFSRAAWKIHVTLDLLEDIGFAQEARRCRARADRWIAEMDDRAKVFDLARNYQETEESCPRGLVVLREFVDAHGAEAINKVARRSPDEDAGEYLPCHYAWPSDHTIYHLSIAAGKDFFPWFAERGLTVHPLPIVKPDAKDVKGQMLNRLNKVLRDETESLSSRLDAAYDLCTIGSEKDFGTDECGALCSALKLTEQGDKQAGNELRKLFGARKPTEIRAIASVLLAEIGDASVADELIPLARQFEPRFQLAAGHALAKAGSERAGELSLENLRDAQGNPAGELEIQFDGEIVMHCKVEDYRVNNIVSSTRLQPFTKDAAISIQYLDWVHTSPFWRRRGLSRQTMAATMNHPAAKKCSCCELGTDTANFARRIYREFGFIERVASAREWTCELPENVQTVRPRGVRLREYQVADHAQAAALSRQMWGTRPCFRGPPHFEVEPSESAYVAERRGDLVGLAAAHYAGEDCAQITRFVVRDDPQADRVADALLALVHQGVQRAGAERISWYFAPEDERIHGALSRAGYEAKPTIGMWLMYVRDLVRFLREITPVLEKRLAESDFKQWTGKIDLLASRLHGRITVDQGAVQISAPGARPADIVLNCDDDTATRLALGCETPGEAYLQARLTIEPRVSETITKLLETLFPRVPLA